MNIGMIKAILILPGTALVYVPVLLVWLTRNTAYAARGMPDNVTGWLGATLFGGLGLVLMIWSMRLFMTKGGGGTPAPWEPINNLIILGPYQYVRNPMLSGVIFFLIAEAFFFQSWPIFGWAVFFFVLNTVYFARFEEPQLEQRYGAPYVQYKQNVPRWLPRTTAYPGGEKT